MYILEQRFDASLETQTDGITKMGMHTIENAIFEKYHFSLIECCKNTYKLESILRKVFGPGQILLERTVLKNLIYLLFFLFRGYYAKSYSHIESLVHF